MKNILLLLTTSVLLLACQQSKVTQANNVDEHSSTASAVETPIAVAVKAGNSLKVEHRLSSERAKIGVPYEIELDFTGPADSSFTAEFSATPGLSLTSNTTAAIQMDNIGKSETKKIVLLPQQEGIHFVTIYRAGVNQQEKPTAIKVIVGDKDIKEYLQTLGTIVEQEDGSKVISMKADEG